MRVGFLAAGQADHHRNLDQMGAVVGEPAITSAGRREESGVASHHHGDIDARQGFVVEIGARQRQGDVTRRRSETGAVIR